MKKMIVATTLLAIIFSGLYLISNFKNTMMLNSNAGDISSNEVLPNPTSSDKQTKIPSSEQPENDNLEDKPLENGLNDTENKFNESKIMIKSKINLSSSTDSDVTVIEKTISTEDEASVITTVQPEIHGLKDKQFENEINKKIANYYQNEIKEIESSAAEYLEDMKRNNYSAHQFELTMNYEMIVSGNLVHILITTRTYTGGATDMVRVMSLNMINESNGKEVCITDIFDLNTMNHLIIQHMNNNEKYYPTNLSGELRFQSVREDQAFYIENNTLYVLFNKYEIAPGAAEIQTISIPII
ncbi:DUF3298 and DUF4163 domain-containing protein [Chengkuizengella axinellae]|uniref:DUF4163 domain-containing protein n=1 Tax=Chengkuizengella axinellae TaxID=3064388 RepID=A0ABT9J486_9BACL|nr:DUF3298 and DUF4163 domain-containing protein [Chengkuizengella sp. 2205SS18-9]MDP5276460.1 DUF4163 domain-containing protein [Chengkuizengella sp. 2205SS18-9]